ncbi:hypothetical protein GOBAR_DD30526 [Gossypium barbadense]|nr:hypothetical protein GOBAR_DD30526 [Gossypium barbadense]
MDLVVSVMLQAALTSGVAFGLVNPTLGCLADKCNLSKFSTFGIFVVSGLTLRSDAIGAAVKAWPVGLFGLLAGGNSALALAMTVLSNLLGILIIPFSISKFIAVGVGVYVPTAQLLKSLVLTLLVPLILGKVLRESSRGPGSSFVDEPCRGTLRFLGHWILASASSTPAHPGASLKVEHSLIDAFLHPTASSDRLAQLAFATTPVGSLNQATAYESSAHSSTGMLSEPWATPTAWELTVSCSTSLFDGGSFHPSLTGLVPNRDQSIACEQGDASRLLHLGLLAFNALAIRSLSAVSGGHKSIFSKKENAQAALLVASQKTLPVMVAVVQQLGGAFGESGLLVLPCVAAHLIQIVLDSFLANFWLRKELSLNTAKVA